MNIDGQKLVDALKAQRNGALDEAAALKAALDGAQERIAEMEAELKELRKPKK